MTYVGGHTDTQLWQQEWHTLLDQWTEGDSLNYTPNCMDLHVCLTAASQLCMQVYYAPRQPVYCQVTLPTIFGGFRLLRIILIRERITLVHAHQAFSVMGHEAILHARTMGYKVTQAMCPALASAAQLCRHHRRAKHTFILKTALLSSVTTLCLRIQYARVPCYRNQYAQ